jgi:cupin fold WbuC family metalloprotein
MNERLQRLSEVATGSGHGRVARIDRELVRRKAEDARRNPRRREIHVLHRGDADTLHRMLNALQLGTYVRPHRHLEPPKAEAFVVLQGAAAFVPFLDDGTVDLDGLTLLDRERGALAVDCREGIWHSFLALEPDTVLYEVKPGPYDAATDKEFAPWAPGEGTPEAEGYRERLEAEVRRRLGAAAPE